MAWIVCDTNGLLQRLECCVRIARADLDRAEDGKGAGACPNEVRTSLSDCHPRHVDRLIDGPKVRLTPGARCVKDSKIVGGEIRTINCVQRILGTDEVFFLEAHHPAVLELVLCVGL